MKIIGDNAIVATEITEIMGITGIDTTSGNQLVITNCNQNSNANSFDYQVTSTDGVTARINIVPNNTNNNGCGCRRR